MLHGKKYLIFFVLSLVSLPWCSQAFASPASDAAVLSAINQITTGNGIATPKGIMSNESGPVTIMVSEKIPGATCACATKGFEGQEECPSDLDVSARLYTCTVDKGMTAFQNIIRDITKWFIYITMLLGVLALVGAGVLWAWGSESEEYAKKAKGWALNIIIGLALLFTFRYILGFLAPWIFQ